MTIEQLNNEIVALDKRISNICRQINLPTTENDIKSQMDEFLQVKFQILKLIHLIIFMYVYNNFRWLKMRLNCYMVS